MTDTPPEWPPPQPDPVLEPHHRAGRIEDSERGQERGDVLDDPDD